MAYDPLRDSNDQGRRKLVLDPDPSLGVLIVTEPGECLCGCHERPSRKSRWFKPGHDNRFRGVLLKAEKAGVPVTVVVAGQRVTRAGDAWRAVLAGRPAAAEKERRVIKRATDLVERQDDLTDDEHREMVNLLDRLGVGPER